MFTQFWHLNMQEVPNTAAESAFLGTGSAARPLAAGSPTGKQLVLSALPGQGKAHLEF